jgi:hypothetical protein
MPDLPLLEPIPAKPGTRGKGAARGPRDDGVVLAVYAPFGTDEVLSRYPNPNPAAPIAAIQNQLLVRSLQKVAAEGINVSALVDLFDDDTWLVEIPAGKPKDISIVSAWKQDMSAPQALAGFLRRVSQRFPCSTLVLALEGHGGGFVPDIDTARITVEKVTRYPGGTLSWTKDSQGSSFTPDAGSPALPMFSPELPMFSPELPASRLPMSTWALGEALRSAQAAGVQRPAVIHFANCFNASVELLHTVAPYADVATGYTNYDFFTAGETYPLVFRRLRLAGSATREQLAQWFAEENARALRAKKNHPTVGATVVLSRMKTVAAAIDALAIELTKALRSPQRPAVITRIQAAATNAQHYDTQPGYELQVPDQLVDIGSFAVHLQAQFPAADEINKKAVLLQTAAAGVWQYGDFERPWLDETRIWDFRKQHLGLNILLPDPALQGVWEWRSPYYLSGKADPKAPPAHRHVIPFLADVGKQRPRWVEFIVEYHREVKFRRFLPAIAPFFPIYNASFKPELPPPGDNPPTTGGKR